ncbi:DUF4350 domain-containing protein [Arthrobacter mobilis]|uniref:DUF4350 domain-containing protein n=1 Tax=Arthrobacter mobilis TaxID=2724944 RepID=A0A7X6HCQ0_9MICC|nr:DUF4350 domain-containing protein [Arthrobacter mobilis]NKX53819.1 DUF4350 domain-containing protein [Arthrobacter mobilis]
MTAPAGVLPDTAPADGTAPSGTRSPLRQVLRRWGFWFLLFLLLAGMVVLQLVRSAGDTRGLSPGNAAPDGAKAVAEVLRAQGVQVLVPQSLEEAGGLLAGREPATLLLHDADGYLQPAQLELLEDKAARLVLVEPSLPQLRALAPGVLPAGLVPGDGGPLPADCSVPGPAAASAISRGGLAYRADSLCFTFDTPADPAGAYATTGGGSTVVLGAGHVLSNGRITEQGNAALALHTLGSTARLIWYQPSADDVQLTEQPREPLSLLPAWVHPVSLWLLGTGVLAMLWRGRRLGPLVTEPLPVVVPAAETAQGRARLYQQSKAVARAAANLRAGTLARLAAHLRLGPGADAAAVVHATAAALGTAAGSLPSGQPGAAGPSGPSARYSPPQLEHLLLTYTPGTEAQLAAWARDLLALEKEVIRR